MKQRETTKPPRRKHRFWPILVIMIGILSIGAIYAIIADSANRQELQTIQIGTIDFSALKDGTYSGSFIGKSGSQRDATVEVTISGGELGEIRVLQGAIGEDGTPTELSSGQTIQTLFSRVRESGSFQVDVISGATLTSKAHLKALEDALLQAQDTTKP